MTPDTELSFPSLPREISVRELRSISESQPTVDDVTRHISQIIYSESDEFWNQSDFHPHSSAHGRRRVTIAELRLIRERVLEIASTCGFPNQRVATPPNHFEQVLATRLPGILQMHPAEAYFAGTWDFLTLRVLADVAQWRWRLGSELNSAVANRWRGDGRRQFLKQAHRRGVLLGNAVLGLTEEDLMQIIERPGLTGNELIASAVGSFQVTKRLSRDEFRSFMKELGRIATQRAVFNAEIASQLIVDAENFVSLRSPDSFVTQTSMEAGVSALDVFLTTCGDNYLEFLERFMNHDQSRFSEIEVGRLLKLAIATNASAEGYQAECVLLCEFLLTVVDSLPPDCLHVIYVAVKYFLMEDDLIADEIDGGYQDDLVVLEAARAAVIAAIEMKEDRHAS